MRHEVPPAGRVAVVVEPGAEDEVGGGAEENAATYGGSLVGGDSSAKRGERW